MLAHVVSVVSHGILMSCLGEIKLERVGLAGMLCWFRCDKTRES
jgi:hypothetical protein